MGSSRDAKDWMGMLKGRLLSIRNRIFCRIWVNLLYSELIIPYNACKKVAVKSRAIAAKTRKGEVNKGNQLPNSIFETP